MPPISSNVPGYSKPSARRHRRWAGTAAVLLAAVLTAGLALPAEAQQVTLSLGSGADSAPSGAQSLTTNVVGIIVVTTLLSLAPGLLVVGTAFTRIVIVLSMLRTALGLQQAPPNSVVVSLSLFLAAFVMAPTLETAWRDAARPLIDGSITEEQAADRAILPFRAFMEANVRESDLALFTELAKTRQQKPAQEGGQQDTQRANRNASFSRPSGGNTLAARETAAQAPLYVLAPAFMISELHRAFTIGFLLFLPFLVIDLAIASVLMGMGMMMLPPSVVSLPFKLIFFVLIDGWALISGALVRGFNQ